MSENLHAALRELQLPQAQPRFLWIDAICIAQHDHKEKSFQVSNMFLIYRKARTVIAWLGSGTDDIDSFLMDVMNDATELSNRSIGHNVFWKVLHGLRDLYERPYFQRTWVQQEMFAARDLQFQCGSYTFQWSQRLSSPKEYLEGLLLASPQTAILEHKLLLSRTMDKKSLRKILSSKATEDVPTAEQVAMDEVISLGRSRLHFFESIRENTMSPPDFSDTLLKTRTLLAANAVDYIYGLLDMTAFPSRAMSIADWMVSKQQEVFVPIDYSASLSQVLCTVTWAILMKGGLQFLTKFKVFSGENDSSSPSLPSWVIDWKLAADILRQKEFVSMDTKSVEHKITLGNPWDIFQYQVMDRG